MELLIYLLSTVLAVFTGYVISKKMGFLIGAFLVGFPIFRNGVDVFVDGNQTGYRQIFFAFYVLVLLLIALNYKRTRE